MNWFLQLFMQQSALQAVCVLSVIIALGLGLGKVRIGGVSLGVACVFFVGILAGHLGFAIDPMMLEYAMDFGLVLFVYELGLKVGPGFFSSFRSGGLKLNMLALALVLLGTLTAVAISLGMGIPMSDMVGILSGATTNTPALGAAQQALQQAGIPASGAALSCAVTYPLGVVGVILALALVKTLFTRASDMRPNGLNDSDHTFVAEFVVSNPAADGQTLRDLHRSINRKFVVSRIWRQGEVSIPGPDERLHTDDHILVVCNEEDLPTLTIIFGQRMSKDWNRPNIDWNDIDKKLISKVVVVSKPALNGKRLGSLRLRNTYDINISRVTRAGIRLLATPDLVLQLGDRLTIVGQAHAVDRVQKMLGNSVSDLNDPNLAAVFIGLVLGLVLGSIPIVVPGMSMPIKLGLAGGPIVVGILIGSFGPRFHLVTYTTSSANLMLRGIGLALYLACLGLQSGANFLETVMRADGLMWIAIGFFITLVPTAIMTLACMRVWRVDYGTAAGLVCGAMANPMALTYADTVAKASAAEPATVQNGGGETKEAGTLAQSAGDEPSVAYATVYPLSMFMRVIIAQILVLLFL